MMDSRLPEDFVPEGNRNDNRSSAHGIQINTVGKSNLLIIAILGAVSLGLGIGQAVFHKFEIDEMRSRHEHEMTQMVEEMRKVETEHRMLQYYVEGLQRTMAVNGFSDPGDDYSWFKKKQQEKH